MSIFLSFALMGLTIFLIAALTRPPANLDSAGDNPSMGFLEAAQAQIAKLCPMDPLARWVAAVLLASSALSSLLVWFAWDLLVNAESPQTQFQEFLGSRYAGSAFFGVVFGVVFGYWLSSVLYRDKEKPASYGEIVAGVLMAILLVLGLAGQDALTTALARLTSLEIGPAKFGFNETGGIAKSPTALANNAQPGSPQASNGGPNQSSGLQTLVELPGYIKRDAYYARLLVRAKDGANVELSKTIFAELKGAQENVDNVLGPFAQCLSAYVEATGDDGRVGRLLEAVAAHLRGFVRNHRSPPMVPPKWEQTFVDLANSVLEEAPTKMCEKLVAMVAANPSDLLKPLENPTWQKRPYLSIAYASMLAYEHQYVAAIESLDQWIRQNIDDSGKSEEDKIKTRVFRVRVRSLIAGYVEEWLRGTYGIQTRAVLDYHIDNLTHLIDGINADLDLVIGKTLSQIPSPRNSMIENQFRTLPDDGICSAVDLNQTDEAGEPNLGDPRLTLMLIRTLIAAKLTWIVVALDHPDYFQAFARRAETRADELLRMDLSCLKKFDPYGTAIKRAESLDAFARVQLANRIGTEGLSAVLNRETTRQGLESSLRAVNLGQRVIDESKRKGLKNQVEQPKERFLDSIGTSPIDDTTDGLRRTEKQLNSALADLRR